MRRALFVVVAVVAVVAFARPASAYPWMIRHPYSGCVPCHADPTGGGLLTEYGRAQSEILLRTHYGSKKSDAEDPGTLGNFAWGAPLPEWLLLGATFRDLYFATMTPPPHVSRFVEMQSDARAQITIGRFRASGSLGWVHETDSCGTCHINGREDSITRRDTDNLVSRDHWIGVDLGEDKEVLVRAGRMHLPFGVRTIEHNLWARSYTRTDLDATAQDGVAIAYTGNTVRGEVMGILGNYLIGPDAYRERGYSAFFEVAVGEHAALGASSLLTYAARDMRTNTSNLRQAHGLMARVSPWDPLVLLGEVDALVTIPENLGTLVGFTGFVQADLEPVQGVHFMVTGEALDDGSTGTRPQIGGWLTANWFFLPHVDARFDALSQLIWTGTQYVTSVTLEGQLHVFL